MRRIRTILTLVAVLTALLSACAVTSVDDPATGTVARSTPTTAAPVPSTTTTAVPEAGLSPLAGRVRPLGSARALPPVDAPPAPTSLSIADIGVREAPVVDVGVEPNGEMEIPGAREVGWYRYGPVPGAAGSAVLAAHVAAGGRDGVFRRLADLEVGSVVEVGFDDGSTRRFAVTERARYPKEALPFDRVFAKEGPPVLTLVTCGGAFDRAARSYEDNVVVYAAPLDPPDG